MEKQRSGEADRGVSANRHNLGNAGRALGPLRWFNQFHLWLRRNTRAGAARNIHAHYDLGNDFYRQWLDAQMLYSSAIFNGDAGQSLEDAQAAKMDAVLDRLGLGRGARLLEIGCGWGGLGARALTRFGVRYDGLTLSEEQADWARPLVEPHGGRILLQDYRDSTGQYDAIASVEMVEAVGRAYWPDYLDAIARLLKPGGRAAIQYIAYDDALFESYASNADFIQTYIFPGGCLISVNEFRALAEARGLAWRDQHDFALDYAETLRRWRERYDAARAEGRLPDGFDEDFHRLWQYYLMYCEGGFRGGGITVAQVTLEKSG